MEQHQVHTPSPSQTTPETGESSEAVSAVAIRLPPYGERNPAVWFLQVESQFQQSRITSQQRQFHHLVGALPSTAAEEVVDIITSFRSDPPGEGTFDEVRQGEVAVLVANSAVGPDGCWRTTTEMREGLQPQVFHLIVNHYSDPSNPVLTHPSVLITLIAFALCRARMLSVCIRTKQLPLDLHIMFGCFSPSTSHGVRVCKILRSECLRRERLFREYLYIEIQGERTSRRAKKKRWWNCKALIDDEVEHLWLQTMPHLRRSAPTAVGAHSGVVHKEGNFILPDFVESTLALGPKFAVEKRNTPVGLVHMVRSVANRVPDSERDRCVSEGIEVVSRHVRA
ncbi:hypothetical protein MTO96_003074 [Rhipicephalus appendiculatus]